MVRLRVGRGYFGTYMKDDSGSGAIVEGQKKSFRNNLYFNIGQLVEVRLRTREDFPRIRETLTRIGNNDDGDASGNILRQVCYILYKQGRYFITHINELRKLDGESVNILEDDIAVRNLITSLLVEWKLLEIVDPSSIRLPVAAMSKVRVVKHKDKSRWTLLSEYDIGRKR